MVLDPERRRLRENDLRQKNWSRWGPYLSERQWGTVREDYSPDGSCWSYFPHEHARSRTYRWGEDGLLGITDRQCRLCFSFAFWNGEDPFLKERLFGLTGPEGNNGEDVKECYYYLDNTPTHSYMRMLYKYPQKRFPYETLVEENKRRLQGESECELLDLGIFDDEKYFDIEVEYAKNSPDDILVVLTVHNRADKKAPLSILPTVWFRNTWSWGRKGEAYLDAPPSITKTDKNLIQCDHPALGRFFFADERATKSGSAQAELLFTENQTNMERLFAFESSSPYVKDSFHDYVVQGRKEAVNPAQQGTKAAAFRTEIIPANGSKKFQFRLYQDGARNDTDPLFGEKFKGIVAKRVREAATFYEPLLPVGTTPDDKEIIKQAYGGLLWTKQFYYYSVKEWLEGDPTQPAPAPQRKSVRNIGWSHLYNRDVISMPDKWEYPWYAAWDTAFHMIPFSRVDPTFTKKQLLLFLREWFMHPNGQIPAYEFAFSDVNPPVHAWACWRVYKMADEHQKRDRVFLAQVFHKLLLNFTWWVNQKDLEGNNLFSGGFLGLDNIGVFDRSAPLPVGGHLEQADATAWMAFYCGTMLSMALELAAEDPAYEDVASKFFEHFVSITDAINHFAGPGLWDQLDGFYYDQLNVEGHATPLRVRSLVGLLPMIAVEVLDHRVIKKLPGFQKRLHWFLQNQTELAQHVTTKTYEDRPEGISLLAIPSRERLERMLRYLFDEEEFLSPYGIRSLSKIHDHYPYVFQVDDSRYMVEYCPGESKTTMFGGNSNWRGPVWYPINYLIIEALERYHFFYRDSFLVEFPRGSGNKVTLLEASKLLAQRLTTLFIPDSQGRRPCHGKDKRYAKDPNWNKLLLFYEYFHGDEGKGLGASHQTGWTALVTRCFEKLSGH